MLLRDVMLTGVERRREAIEEARAAGRLGADRLPVTVLFHGGHELSDTGIVKCDLALQEGRAERERAKAITEYMIWLADNRETLAEDLDRAIAEGLDIHGWLTDRYFDVSGVRL